MIFLKDLAKKRVKSVVKKSILISGLVLPTKNSFFGQTIKHPKRLSNPDCYLLPQKVFHPQKLNLFLIFGWDSFFEG